jgi:two-component system nitrogen regulation response regulator GlnG
MLANQQNVHTSLPPQEKVSILVVSPDPEDQTALRRILHHSNWAISQCANAADALEQVHSTVPAVILCERELPDGNWKTVLSACENSPDSPLLLVTSKTADENLWAEVLNLGGYDVLMKPFELGEVTRVIGMAWRQWFTRSLRQSIISTAPPQRFSAHIA